MIETTIIQNIKRTSSKFCELMERTESLKNVFTIAGWYK